MLRHAILAVMLILLVFSLYFMYASLNAGAGHTIGVFFPAFFMLVLSSVTAAYRPLRRLLKRAFAPLIITFYASAVIFVIFFIIFCIYILNFSMGTPPDDIDLILVLGCQTFGMNPSRSLKTRLEKAYDMLMKYPEALCLVAGGQGPDETVSEAHAMKEYLKNAGIDENRIIMEDKSSSTYENIIFAKDVLDEESIKYDKVLIVTNEYHIPRSVMIAASHGIKAYASGASSPSGLFGAGLVREFFAFVKSYIFDRASGA